MVWRYDARLLNGVFALTLGRPLLWVDFPNSAIDINKAYTSNLLDIEFSPVFSVLDAFLDYDNHPVEDYTQYIIVSNESNTEASILIKKNITVLRI